EPAVPSLEVLGRKARPAADLQHILTRPFRGRRQRPHQALPPRDPGGRVKVLGAVRRRDLIEQRAIAAFVVASAPERGPARHPPPSDAVTTDCACRSCPPPLRKSPCSSQKAAAGSSCPSGSSARTR